VCYGEIEVTEKKNLEGDTKTKRSAKTKMKVNSKRSNLLVGDCDRRVI